MSVRAVGEPLTLPELDELIARLDAKGQAAGAARSEAEVKSVEQMRHRDKDRGLPWPA